MKLDKTVPQIVDALALAVIETSDVPLVLLDARFTIVAASASFCQTFGLEKADITGQPLFGIGGGEWDAPQLKSLLKATLSGDARIDAYEMDFDQPGRGKRHMVLKAHTLDDGGANLRLMLAVSDVTAARLAHRQKDDLISEKALLLQELQHRVANSLQIIASVLMQSARRTASEETRNDLFDAHSRVMSVATLQHQLENSRIGDVNLKSYFKELCDSIGASMIRDPKSLTLEVESDSTTTTASASVSLGLIVTELVINSLKHGFPDARGGRIHVSFHSDGPEWTLTVSDDGVGIPKDPAKATAGLGTSIVQALARQLQATVTVTSAEPGTRVAIEHKESLAGVPEVKPPKAV